MSTKGMVGNFLVLNFLINDLKQYLKILISFGRNSSLFNQSIYFIIFARGVEFPKVVGG
jgi:hypothetical protein